MPDLLDNIGKFLRMRNIFGPVGPNLETGQGTYTGQPVLSRPPVVRESYAPPTDIGFDRPTRDVFSDRTPISPLAKYGYEPETRAQEKLYGMLETLPERNKPGILRKIAASVVGVGGGTEAEKQQVLYGPYNRQLADWKTQFDPTRQVAEQERLSNTQLRAIAEAALRDEQAQRRLDIQQQGANTAQQRADISRMRAEAYVALQNFKMQNPDWEIVKQEGGNYILINPRTGETKDSGIKTGTLDELTELNLRIKGQKEVAAIPRTTFGSTSTTTTTTGGTGAESASQEKVAQYNRAREMFNKNPHLQSFIQLGDPGTNDFTISAPREPGFIREGFSKADYDSVINYIYQGGTAPTVGKTTTTTTQRQTTSQRGAPVKPATRTGTVRVKRLSDGQTGNWDLSKGPVPTGYEEIK